MPDSNQLKAAVQRLTEGTSNDDDRLAVQQALLAGHLVYTTGERNVAIDRDVTGAIIITGDQNQLRFDLPEAAYAQLRDRLFPHS